MSWRITVGCALVACGVIVGSAQLRAADAVDAALREVHSLIPGIEPEVVTDCKTVVWAVNALAQSQDELMQRQPFDAEAVFNVEGTYFVKEKQSDQWLLGHYST